MFCFDHNISFEELNLTVYVLSINYLVLEYYRSLIKFSIRNSLKSCKAFIFP